MKMANASTVRVTLEINQETSLDELMAHLCLMQGSIDPQSTARIADTDDQLADFSIHEGELAPANSDFLLA